MLHMTNTLHNNLIQYLRNNTREPIPKETFSEPIRITKNVTFVHILTTI